MMSSQSPPLTIRRARHADVEAMTSVAMLAKQSNGYDDAFMAMCADELRVTPEKLDVSRYWVAERDGICGCAALSPTDQMGVGEVHAFFIHPDFQKQGIGRALWQIVLATAKSDGLTTLYLDADPNAERFYELLGFRTIGRNPSGSIPGRTIPMMELKLPV